MVMATGSWVTGMNYNVACSVVAPPVRPCPLDVRQGPRGQVARDDHAGVDGDKVVVCVQGDRERHASITRKHTGTLQGSATACCHTEHTYAGIHAAPHSVCLF